MRDQQDDAYRESIYILNFHWEYGVTRKRTLKLPDFFRVYDDFCKNPFFSKKK